MSAVPFLVVGLIACIRRILVIEVRADGSADAGAAVARAFDPRQIELGVLAALVLVLVWSIVLLRRQTVEKAR